MRLLRLLIVSAFLFPAGAEQRTTTGMYIWGQLAAGLPEAVEDAKKLGLDRAARIYIGPFWDPTTPDDKRPLDEKVLRHDYQRALRAFPTLMITAYAASGMDSYKYAEATVDLTAVRKEFERFAYELGRLPGRYIVSNWEFENDCPETLWTRCTEYQQSRIDGIIAGREAARRAGFPAKVYAAFEFFVLPEFVGRKSGYTEVGAKLKGLDYLSYSSWYSMQDLDPVMIRASFHEAFGRLARVMPPDRTIVGEFGDLWDRYPTIDRLLAIVAECEEHGIAYAFNWVLYEQDGQKDAKGIDASHWGKYFLDRRLTPHGEAFQKAFVRPRPRLKRPELAPAR